MAVRRNASSSRSLGRHQTPTPSGQLDQATKTTGTTIPKTNRDPTWSLCPWPLIIALGDQEVEIPPLPALNWLQFLFEDVPDLDGIISEIMPEIDEYFFENEYPVMDMYIMVLETLEQVAARPWWLTLRLITVVKEAWHIMGPKLMIAGVDANQVSLAAWLDVSLYLIMENMHPDNVAMFTSQLQMPPPEDIVHGTATTPLESEEMVMDRGSFLAFASG